MPSENLILKTKVTGTSQANAALGKMDKTIGKVAAKYAKMGALAVGALGVVAVKQAAQFEKAMSNVSTLISGDATPAIEKLSEGIKDMMGVVPVDAEQLGASAYSIVSAGISDMDQALIVLEASSKLAVSGLGSAEESTDLLTTAINAFGLNADEADKAADVLFKTVKSGKTTVGDLSRAFGKMAGNASAASVTFIDAQAATAALTTVTGKTAESQNALAQVFLELTIAGGKLDKGLSTNGSSLDKLNDAIGKKGLVKGFEDVRDELKLTDTQFKNLFSSAEGGTAVFQLLTSANEAYIDTAESMTDGSDALTEAFDKQKESTHAQWQLLKNHFNVALMELGDRVLPSLVTAMEGLNSIMGASREGTILAGDSVAEFTDANTSLAEAVENTTGIEKEFLEQVEFISLRGVHAYEALEKGHNTAFMNIIQQRDEDIAQTRNWLDENRVALKESGIAFDNFSDEAILSIALIDIEIAKSINAKSNQGAQIMSLLTNGLGSGQAGLSSMIDGINNQLDEIGNLSALENISWVTQLGSSFSEGGVVPEYAEGGKVQRFAGGGAARGTDTVPAMLTPGEVVLNAAQQKNVAGTIGNGIHVEFNGVFGEGAAEEIWDMLSSRLAESSAI